MRPLRCRPGQNQRVPALWAENSVRAETDRQADRQTGPGEQRLSPAMTSLGTRITSLSLGLSFPTCKMRKVGFQTSEFFGVEELCIPSKSTYVRQKGELSRQVRG